MSKDVKDSKHKPDNTRQPQRKDSLSSILSWAALQGRISTVKAPSSFSSSSTSPLTPPGNGSKPRRHSHSAASSDSKPKARRGSATFRRLSFPLSTTNQRGASSTKTRHAKTSSMTPDAKASPGTSKASKSISSEKVSKAASDADHSKMSLPPRPQSAGDKPRSPSTPIVMPKSILRVSSPDGNRRPRQFVSPETGEPITGPDLSPSPSRPGSPSPPASPPIPRPMSPGTTVRFAKATIHRVEVIGPGRRLLPVKRKSKSTLTYISPLDPGAPQQQKKGGGSPNLLLPKTTLQSPTKLRRHQENQAAMGRYWLRTEEEEAQWRAEAERRAREEAERYRNEPSSPVPGAAATEKTAVADGEEVETGDKAIGAVAKMLPLLDVSGSNDSPALDKLEEVIESEDEDTDEEAGAKCTVKDDDETESVELIGTQESKSFSERLAERQAAEENAHRAASPLHTPIRISEELSCKAGTESSKLDRSSSSGSLTKDQDSMNSEAASARSSNTSTGSTTTANSGSSSAEQLSRSPSKDKNKEKEKEKETEKARDKPMTASTSSSSSSSRSYMNLKPTGDRDRERDHDRDKTQKSYGSRSTAGHSSNNSNSTNSSSNRANHGRRGSSGSSSSSSSHNHLHLSGRRGRRYFESHKQGITA